MSERGKINRDFYNTNDINKRLGEKYGKTRIFSSNEKGVYLNIVEDKIDLGIPYEKRGSIPKEKLEKIAKEISKGFKEDKEEVLEYLTTPLRKVDMQQFNKSIRRVAIFIFALGAIFFALPKNNFLTGSVVADISNRTSNIGLLICALLVVGAIIYGRKK